MLKKYIIAAAGRMEQQCRSDSGVSGYGEMQDFSKLQDLTGQDHENAVLGNIAPADARVTRMDSDVYLQAEQNEAGKLILTWQIGLTLRNAENTSENKTLTFKMEKNGKETWVITEAKLS
ncbi:MAG: hypothetical protein ACLSFT_00420 [Ruminococcus callidus]